MISNKVVSNGATLKIAAHLSVAEYFLEKISQKCEQDGGDALALINASTGDQLTYKQLLQATVSVAVGLRKLGVKRGDVVAFYSESRNELVPGYMGALCCGATITMYNTMYNKDELEHVINISKPSVVICSETALEAHIEVLKTTKSIIHIIQINGKLISEALSLDDVMEDVDPRSYEPETIAGASDIAAIFYSSGTTGLPKGAMITHLNILYSWVIGMYVVPPILVFLAKSALVKQYDLSSVKCLWCGAAPLGPQTADEMAKIFPNITQVLQAYGMTETTLAVLKETDEPGARAGYLPIPGSKVKIVDTVTREKLGPNEHGEIRIKSPSLMKGYVDNELATKDSFDEEGFLKTGDIGFYDENGYFSVVDRLKEIIKYKGHQVAPATIENVILQHSGVAECGVVGAPHELAGELPTAFVVPKPGVSLTEHELLQFTNDRLSPLARIRGGVIIIDEIPKSPSGKILRRMLKEKYFNKK